MKGIAGLTQQDADATFHAGLVCNWRRRMHLIDPIEVVERLTELDVVAAKR
jgi:hypothetical protein